jgi:hypothetical protein
MQIGPELRACAGTSYRPHEQGATLGACERVAERALEAASRAQDMSAVRGAIAEGQLSLLSSASMPMQAFTENAGTTTPSGRTYDAEPSGARSGAASHRGVAGGWYRGTLRGITLMGEAP